MDEQLSQVFNFLFVPEAFLSVVFLVIFIILLFFGIYVCWSARKKLNIIKDTAIDHYEETSNKMTPETYLKKELDSLSAREGVLEGIPDVFVSVGITATFIGLGVAIQEAVGLLTSEKFEMEQMIGLLGIIAFKFQTSVWGIAFSLVFRRFGVELYFIYRQKVIDTIRALLQEKERDSIQLLLEKQNALLLEERDIRRNADNTLLRKLDALLKQSLDRYDEADKIRLEQMKNNEKLLDSLKSINESAVNHIQELFTQQEKHFSERTNENNKLMETHANRLSLWKNELNEKLTENNKVSLDSLNVLTMIQEKFAALDAATQEYSKSANKFTAEVINFNEQVKAFRQENTESLERIDETLVEIGDKQYDTLVKMHQHVEDLQKIFLRDESQYVRETRESFRRVLEDSENTFKNILSDNVSSVQNSYETEVKRFANLTGNLSEVLAKIDKNVAKLHKEITTEQKKLSSTQQATLMAMEKEIFDMGENVEKQQNSFNGYYHQIKKVVDNLASAQEKLVVEQSKSLKSSVTSFDKVLKELQNKQEFFNEKLKQDHLLLRGDVIEAMSLMNSGVVSVEDRLKEMKTGLITVNDNLTALKEMAHKAEEISIAISSIPNQLAISLQDSLPSEHILSALGNLVEGQREIVMAEKRLATIMEPGQANEPKCPLLAADQQSIIESDKEINPMITENKDIIAGPEENINK